MYLRGHLCIILLYISFEGVKLFLKNLQKERLKEKIEENENLFLVIFFCTASHVTRNYDVVFELSSWWEKAEKMFKAFGYLHVVVGDLVAAISAFCLKSGERKIKIKTQFSLGIRRVLTLIAVRHHAVVA